MVLPVEVQWCDHDISQDLGLPKHVAGLCRQPDLVVPAKQAEWRVVAARNHASFSKLAVREMKISGMTVSMTTIAYISSIYPYANIVFRKWHLRTSFGHECKSPSAGRPHPAVRNSGLPTVMFMASRPAMAAFALYTTTPACHRNLRFIYWLHMVRSIT